MCQASCEARLLVFCLLISIIAGGVGVAVDVAFAVWLLV